MPEDRFRWRGACGNGHTDFIVLLYGETPEQSGYGYCNLLLRDKEGAWKEEYGTCGSKMRWINDGQITTNGYYRQRVRGSTNGRI